MSWHSFRKALRTVHLWAALIFSLPVVVIGLTGSALLVQREYLALAVPGASTSGPRKPIPNIVAAAVAAAPAGMSPKRIDLPRGAGSAATVRFTPAERGRPERDIYVDPVSLEVLGGAEVVERGPLLALLIETHAFLQLPPHIGLPVVCLAGIVMTFMALSGLILWWPRKGQWARGFLIRRGARGLRFHLDLHHAAGIWGLVVLLLVSLSGIYLTYPQIIGPFVRTIFPGEDREAVPQPGFVPGKGPIGPEQAILLAAAAIPNARPTGVQFGGADDPLVVDLEPQGWSPSTPAALVILDRATAEVLYIEDPRAHPLRERILNWQSVIHFGTGMGWVWKGMVFLSGLLPALLAATGITIWWKTRKARGRGRGS